MINGVTAEEHERYYRVATTEGHVLAAVDVHAFLVCHKVFAEVFFVELECSLLVIAFTCKYLDKTRAFLEEMDCVRFADNAPRCIIICTAHAYDCTERIGIRWQVSTDKVFLVLLHIKGVERERVSFFSGSVQLRIHDKPVRKLWRGRLVGTHNNRGSDFLSLLVAFVYLPYHLVRFVLLREHTVEIQQGAVADVRRINSSFQEIRQREILGLTLIPTFVLHIRQGIGIGRHDCFLVLYKERVQILRRVKAEGILVSTRLGCHAVYEARETCSDGCNTVFAMRFQFDVRIDHVGRSDRFERRGWDSCTVQDDFAVIGFVCHDLHEELLHRIICLVLDFLRIETHFLRAVAPGNNQCVGRVTPVIGYLVAANIHGLRVIRTATQIIVAQYRIVGGDYERGVGLVELQGIVSGEGLSAVKRDGLCAGRTGVGHFRIVVRGSHLHTVTQRSARQCHIKLRAPHGLRNTLLESMACRVSTVVRNLR